MTMPEFEQAFSAFENTEPYPITTKNVFKAGYAAGQADGKSIPMKYRRMAFNAQLQQDLKVAEAELIAARREIKTLQANLRMANWERAEVELFEQLATAQAHNEQLREALSLVESVYRLNVVEEGEPSSVLEAIQKALSAQPDNFGGKTC